MDNKDELSRLSRLAAILTTLQTKRLLTAKELADKFEISKRTIYRDIKALQQSGVPVYSEEGKGYSLLDGYSLPPIMFTEEEANALVTAEKMIARNKDHSLIKFHQNAVAKVKAVLRYSNKDKTDLLSNRIAVMKNFRMERTSDCLSSIQLAITNSRQIQIHYSALHKEETTHRQVEPQALYHTSDNWILIAWCHLRNAYREFRLDRIQSFEVLTTSSVDRKFNLLDYFMVVMAKNKK